MTTRKIAPKLQPSAGPRVAWPWGIADVSAVKALHAGMADEEQQKRIFDLIISVAGVREQTSYPHPSDSDFAGGKRFVGLQFSWALLMDKEEFKQTKEKKK